MAIEKLSKDEMIAEIVRILEDSNEWDVREIYDTVMDELR